MEEEDNDQPGRSHSQQSFSEEEEPREVGPRGDREPPRWRPGEVAVIEEGGADAQSVLDGEGLKLGIITWHASWIEACLEIEPFLKRWPLALSPSPSPHSGVGGTAGI